MKDVSFQPILFCVNRSTNSLPLWQAALGISFGIVVAKELFGGVGRNFMNPALAGRAFLFFCLSGSNFR